MSERLVTSRGRLARLGFVDADLVAEQVQRLGPDPDDIVESLAFSADPDQALRLLLEVLDRCEGPDELREALGAQMALRERLSAVLGASEALGRFLCRHPDAWRDLEGPDPRPGDSVADARDGDQLRVAYHRRLLQVAARDLTSVLSVDEVSAMLAELADETLDAALAITEREMPEQAARCRLAVIGMGKCGGLELNYVSDVDVIFVAEPADGVGEEAAMRAASQLASGVMRLCGDHTAEGTIWPVDAALRPEGKSGPLVRTLSSHLTYYERWAKTWEFQALLKARPVAGDRALAQEYADAVSALVWTAAERPNFVEDVQAMRRRVVEHIPNHHVQRQIKLGPGGLRDIEFAVQLLQLVHGRGDHTLRSGTTLVALEALTRGGYVGREDGAALAAAYRFLRSLEHRLQLAHLRRTHVVPESAEELRVLGRSLGYLSDSRRSLTDAWKRHAREVRRLHEKLFYRPLLAAVARLPGDEVHLTPEAARQRLTALGYVDPRGALRHLEALTSGVSRSAAIQRTLVPVMLQWFADAPNPDQGLLAFRRVSEELGSTHWYLRQLRDEGAVAERMARVLASSRYATDLLMRAPEAVAMLVQDADLLPRPAEQLRGEMTASAGRYDDPMAAIAAVRAVRRRELFRCSAADLVELADVEDVGRSLTDIAVATLDGALDAAVRAVEAERRGPLPTRLAIVAMGRLGGGEMSYSSDADVLFVHEPEPGASEQEAAESAHAVASELQRMLAVPGDDPPLPVDADLRPEGKQGPLVRSLASYAAYYRRWSSTWETQALLRAAPVCGDAGLGERFVELVDPLRWPQGGLSDAGAREVRRVKARVDAERLPRGADRATHTKLGRGGLADVEWTVQLLQMRHAAEVAGLRTTSTLGALRAAADDGLLAADDADMLATAWRLVSRVRNAMMLVRGRPSDSLPREPRERSGVAYVCGYGADGAEAMIDEYLRVTRHAHAVVERVFWD
jgi:[glutamine synthetase] adenylyltransferase / [glutamine synthetase]-adenylyl-L-tyrosine phosphorylase